MTWVASLSLSSNHQNMKSSSHLGFRRYDRGHTINESIKTTHKVEETFVTWYLLLDRVGATQFRTIELQTKFSATMFGKDF